MSCNEIHLILPLNVFFGEHIEADNIADALSLRNNIHFKSCNCYPVLTSYKLIELIWFEGDIHVSIGGMVTPYEL